MLRRIIQIDEEKCNGCGLCANACHEGAIQMIDGKAKLIKDSYCDGLGDCLPVCPTSAITFVVRESEAYDEKAVKEHLESKNAKKVPFGCPGRAMKTIKRAENNNFAEKNVDVSSKLSQWPVQIKLAPIQADFYENANILIAADCSAYAYGNFHNDFIKNHVVLIGCPKLDNEDYSIKLTEILKYNNVKSVKIVRMEVPCCSGLENAVKKALLNSGKLMPWQVVTISTDGKILE